VGSQDPELLVEVNGPDRLAAEPGQVSYLEKPFLSIFADDLGGPARRMRSGWPVRKDAATNPEWPESLWNLPKAGGEAGVRCSGP
jgi:hypothetical protein